MVLGAPTLTTSLATMNDLTLDKLNRPIHDLRVSVIDRCNFRCNYCMPDKEYSKHYQFLEQKDWLNFDEITRLIKLFVIIGVKKIRLTGGEPLLRPELSKLIHKLAQIPGIEDLALTTNGSHLAKHAHELKSAGLKRLTVSLDTLDSRLFRTMSGERGEIRDVLEGIKTAEMAGFKSLKINVVIQRGVNDHNLMEIVQYFKNTPHILRFIEYMDVGNCNHWQYEYVVPSAEIVKRINAEFPLTAVESNYYGEVAERYRFKDGGGEIGFISSVTQPFCGSCTRARLSTDGQIFTCLFAEKGTDLRHALRQHHSDQEILNLIKSVWQNRNDRYSDLRGETDAHRQKIEMFQIGG
jgi:cyclic pyranopterin phosphate synthase